MTKTAKEVFEVDGGYEKYSYYNYDGVIEAFGTVLLEECLGSYQGDYLVLYQLEDGFGYLTFGYGSCSYCDALQSCDSIEDVQSLMDDLEGSMQKFPNAGEAVAWFRTHDWEGDYFNGSEQRSFVRSAVALLEDMV